MKSTTIKGSIEGGPFRFLHVPGKLHEIWFILADVMIQFVQHCINPECRAVFEVDEWVFVCARCGELIAPARHGDLDHKDDRRGYLRVHALRGGRMGYG